MLQLENKDEMLHIETMDEEDFFIRRDIMEKCEIISLMIDDVEKIHDIIPLPVTSDVLNIIIQFTERHISDVDFGDLDEEDIEVFNRLVDENIPLEERYVGFFKFFSDSLCLRYEYLYHACAKYCAKYILSKYSVEEKRIILNQPDDLSSEDKERIVKVNSMVSIC